jgi:PAS domain S-box-containing protein
LVIPPLPPRYDWRELRKWKIDEKLLPGNSTILFRTPTVWQRYRGWIIGSVAVILVQTALIAALITNLLRRRRAERSLGDSEARIALAAEAAHLGVWQLDPATNEMWVSEKVRELFDLDPAADISLATLDSRVHPEDRATRAASIDGAIRGQGEYMAEYRVVRPDKTLRWISGRGRRMNDVDGKPIRLFGVSMDITERKEAEEEARRQREQIELLGRASLLGEMTASLAHELNQPLAAIVANASAGVRFIDGGETEAGALREIFSDIRSDGHRARGIIQSVRDAIKKGGSVRGRVGINCIVSNVALMVRPDAAANSCEVETVLGEGLPPIEADPIQLQQVLINLVTNAFQAMSDTPPARRKVEMATRLDSDGAVWVTVRDYGTGLSEGAQEQLFEHFYTTKKDGLGLGLAIVRSIIGTHGGMITAENAEGGGARFDFRLPAVAAARK